MGLGVGWTVLSICFFVIEGDEGDLETAVVDFWVTLEVVVVTIFGRGVLSLVEVEFDRVVASELPQSEVSMAIAKTNTMIKTLDMVDVLSLSIWCYCHSESPQPESQSSYNLLSSKQMNSADCKLCSFPFRAQNFLINLKYSARFRMKHAWSGSSSQWGHIGLWKPSL